MSTLNQPVEGASRPQFYGTGRRKESVARVFIKLGAGRFEVNGRPVDGYFKTVAARHAAIEPLKFTETQNQFDVNATVKGGGLSGQAEAVRLGLSRALAQFNAELRPRLRKSGFLTRDSRMKERKKYGQKGARKRFQFSKR